MTQPASTQDNQPAQVAQTEAQQQVHQAQNNNPPQQTQTQQPSHSSQPSQQDNGPIDRLMSALDALPERVAAAVREQTPRHPQPRQPQNNANSGASNTAGASSANQATQQPAPTEKPRKRTLGEWWYGKK